VRVEWKPAQAPPMGPLSPAGIPGVLEGETASVHGAWPANPACPDDPRD